MSGSSGSSGPRGSSDAPVGPALTLGALARLPAWPIEEVLALEGRVKSGLLREWGVHVARRYGSAESDSLRAAIGVSRAELPDAPPPDQWVPVGWQLALTRLIADRHLGGDLLALEPHIMEDARRRPVSLAERIARKTLSPRRILGHSAKIHAALFDRGQCVADVRARAAVLTWTGGRVFGEPTWRVLQAFALRGMFAVLDEPPPSLSATPLAEGLRVELSW